MIESLRNFHISVKCDSRKWFLKISPNFNAGNCRNPISNVTLSCALLSWFYHVSKTLFESHVNNCVSNYAHFIPAYHQRSCTSVFVITARREMSCSVNWLVHARIIIHQWHIYCFGIRCPIKSVSPYYSIHTKSLVEMIYNESLIDWLIEFVSCLSCPWILIGYYCVILF